MVFVVMGGLMSLIGFLVGKHRDPARKALISGGLVLLAASVIVSMVFEDLLPRFSTRPEAQRLPFALSFLGFLLATAMIVYGGRRFVQATFSVIGEIVGQAQAGRKSSFVPQRRVPSSVLFIAWLPGLLWMAAGFLLLALSASAYHESHFPFPWLWVGWS